MGSPRKPAYYKADKQSSELFHGLKQDGNTKLQRGLLGHSASTSPSLFLLICPAQIRRGSPASTWEAIYPRDSGRIQVVTEILTRPHPSVPNRWGCVAKQLFVGNIPTTSREIWRIGQIIHIPALPKCISFLPSYGPPPHLSSPTFRRKPRSLLNACVCFTPVPFLGNSFHMSVALCEKELCLSFSVYSEFPNFMNNFLTMRSIRPWDPVQGEWQSPRQGSSPALPRQSAGGLTTEQAVGAAQTGQLHDLILQIFFHHSILWCTVDSQNDFCHLQQKQNKLLLFPSWEPSKGAGHSWLIRRAACTLTITVGLSLLER